MTGNNEGRRQKIDDLVIESRTEDNEAARNRLIATNMKMKGLASYRDFKTVFCVKNIRRMHGHRYQSYLPVFWWRHYTNGSYVLEL